MKNVGLVCPAAVMAAKHERLLLVHRCFLLIKIQLLYPRLDICCETERLRISDTRLQLQKDDKVRDLTYCSNMEPLAAV